MTLELEQRIIHLAPCAILIRPMRYMIAIEIIALVAALIEASRRVSMRHSWYYDHPFVFSPSLNVKMIIILFTWHPGVVRMCVKILWHDPTPYIVVNMKFTSKSESVETELTRCIGNKCSKRKPDIAFYREFPFCGTCREFGWSKFVECCNRE